MKKVKFNPILALALFSLVLTAAIIMGLIAGAAENDVEPSVEQVEDVVAVELSYAPLVAPPVELTFSNQIWELEPRL